MQSCLELVAQDDVQMALEYLQGRRLHNLSAQFVPLLSHLHSKNVLPDVWTEPPVSVCAHSLWPCQWVPLKIAWFHLLYTFPSGFCSH